MTVGALRLLEEVKAWPPGLGLFCFTYCTGHNTAWLCIYSDWQHHVIAFVFSEYQCFQCVFLKGHLISEET